jgi:hypothetical protein
MRLPSLPSAERFSRARPAILGFAVGVVGMVVLALFSSVVYSGTGIGQTPPVLPPVYTVF